MTKARKLPYLPNLSELFDSLPISLERPVVSSLVWGAHQLLRVRGYKCEVRRSGDLKLGLWRKEFRSKALGKRNPKRFVFLPGFGDTPLSWLSVLTLIEPVLRGNFDEVVLLDFPGYNGILAQESFFPSVDTLMDSLFDVLDSLRPHTIMGHSLGGFLGTHYAAACARTQRISGRKHSYSELERLIVVDPSGVFESELDREEWNKKMQQLFDADTEKWRPYIFAKEPFWFRYVGPYFLKFGARAEVRAFVESSRAEHEIQKILPLIRAQVTLIWGEKDTLIPSSFAASWLKYLTQTKEPPFASIVKGVGHSPQIEAPAVVAAILAQVLSGRAPHSLGKRWYRLLEGESA
jgi:pimeloyl-ACP methyl ester carboxylesterase